MKILILMLSVLASSLSVFASDVDTKILIDGSVARCHSKSDIGQRSYHLKAIDMTDRHITMKLTTYVCASTNGELNLLVDWPLEAPYVYTNKSKTLSYEYPSAHLAVLNTEGTQLLQKINVDTSSSSQLFTIDTQTLRARVFDISLVSFEVIKVNNKIIDQGIRPSGTYRITIK